MTQAELHAELTDLYGTTPEAGEAVHRILAVADCPASRRKVLDAVESGLAVAEFMAGVARAQRRSNGDDPLNAILAAEARAGIDTDAWRQS